jgi:hypothetical protein
MNMEVEQLNLEELGNFERKEPMNGKIQQRLF